MRVPSTASPSSAAWSDLRQRIVVACFREVAAGLAEHLAQPNPSRSELEEDCVVKAVEGLVDSLRAHGRPDLADEMRALYEAALAAVPPA